ncbi:zinc ribbon domain-containing protein [Notoacmeibacter sp. MSK16QG-6]|uniref:zinc ribbon domain-containing protein n=1 Tax=Notoacmeibacter sp. MSK16QG-6 TaxID=2957982 RepID=UPI0020A0181B|nr:zinc ribbon domain-containing protein [Notoacmeibacter sp. MSK16QG-6]MCP1199507.1 zinc ribbon domain-containing protein [Notoacmeibacter sp. MSK16QG-6]
MPSYEFHCADCGNRRGVSGGYAETRDLILICEGCGGDMCVAPVLAVRVLSGAEPPEDASVLRRKPCGHDHNCRCGSIKLNRPNPFRKEIDLANGVIEDS